MYLQPRPMAGGCLMAVPISGVRVLPARCRAPDGLAAIMRELAARVKTFQIGRDDGGK